MCGGACSDPSCLRLHAGRRGADQSRQACQAERRDRLLMHLFQHQIHHRGQAHAMLSGTRIKPPQLEEFFSAADAPFARIGVCRARLDGCNRVGSL